MHNQQQDQSLDCADPLPALFAASCPFDECYAARIVEYQLRSLEIDTVLEQVDLVLPFVPFESDHVYVHISTYGLKMAVLLAQAGGPVFDDHHGELLLAAFRLRH